MHLQFGFPHIWYWLDMLPGCIGPSSISFFFVSTISLSNSKRDLLVFITAKLSSLAVIVNKESENIYE